MIDPDNVMVAAADQDRLQLILPAKRIPPRATVTKRTGSKPYALLLNLVIYTTPSEKGAKATSQVIESPGDARFLSSGDSGVINVVDGDELLACQCTPRELAQWLEEAYGETPQ